VESLVNILIYFGILQKKKPFWYPHGISLKEKEVCTLRFFIGDYETCVARACLLVKAKARLREFGGTCERQRIDGRNTSEDAQSFPYRHPPPRGTLGRSIQ
jgi:hypothetical protein